MRVRKKIGAIDALTEITKYFVATPEDYKDKWRTVFKNENPIHAEFGGGKGKFIIEMAIRNPEINFIMVDAVTEVALKAAERALEHELPNLRIVLIDLQFVLDYFGENELDRIYLNFSDPWPKKRHYKRRLTYRDFLTNYHKILKNQGWIHFKTDNRSLFESSLNEFVEMDLIMKNIALDLHASEFEGNVMTEYEEKFSAQGMPIYRVEVQFRN